MRMFIGFEFSKENLEKIISFQKQINTIGRFTNPQNIHLTLIFLGELQTKEIQIVKNILDNLDYPEFLMQIETVEMLRDIVILKVKNNENLQNLYDDLFVKLRNSGFNIDDRKYFPHVTLVRDSESKVFSKFEIMEKIRKVILFSSERIDGKLQYIPRHQVKLKNG